MKGDTFRRKAVNIGIKFCDIVIPLILAFGVGAIFSLICGCNPLRCMDTLSKGLSYP